MYICSVNEPNAIICVFLERLSKPLQPQSIWDDPDLSPKILHACRIAREKGYRFIWIDSCCIDKSSSSELSEAINSMYKWYGLADMCYAYLADVPPEEDHCAEGSVFRNSRWFSRGWTLQELIAPIHVEFLSQDWAPIGSKITLVDLVESITNIPVDSLLNLEPLGTFSIAERFSWAAKRETTRVEDRAYSLLGIFDINMSTLYGEGEGAFRRLQDQIMQRIPDQSLFAWGEIYLTSPSIANSPKTRNVVALNDVLGQWNATSPYLFTPGIRIPHRNRVQPRTSLREMEYTFTPHGIRTQFLMIPLTEELLRRAVPYTTDIQLKLDPSADDPSRWYLAILGCEHQEHPGHLLGRVCYTPSESGVDFVHAGFIHLDSTDSTSTPDLFPLSPEIIDDYRPHMVLKTVYIPHPNRAHLVSSYGRQPYTSITLVLLRATRDALRFRGYSADLRHPDVAHRTTHRFTLSKDEYTITVQFRHTLEDGGYSLMIDAEVRMSESRVQVDSPLDSDQAGRHTVSWREFMPWNTKLRHQRVRLSTEGAEPLTVDLGLDFVGRGVYALYVDVLSNTQTASSAVELAVDQAVEGERAEECSPSRATNRALEGADREEAGGCEMASAGA